MGEQRRMAVYRFKRRDVMVVLNEMLAEYRAEMAVVRRVIASLERIGTIPDEAEVEAGTP